MEQMVQTDQLVEESNLQLLPIRLDHQERQHRPGTWQTTVPATSASSPYLWTRTIITYTDDTTSTSYAVGSTLEGVSVGGRNLLPKTHKTAVTYKYPTGTNYWDPWNSVTTVPLNGDTYTLSFWAKSDVDGDKI